MPAKGIDLRLIYTAAFLRAVATGMVGVLLGIYLARLGLGGAEIGVVVSAGLAGAVAAAFVASFFGDRLGQRRLLLALACLGAGGGAVAALSGDVLAVALAAFAGMLNGQGRDRGASLVLEQAMLPATVSDAERTRAFAWYNLLQDVGHGLGSAAAALPSLLAAWTGLGPLEACRAMMLVYAALLLAGTVCYMRLSPSVEMTVGRARAPMSPQSRRVITRISALFFVDSLAGGFLGSALVAYFFFERFGAGETAIAALFVGARLLNALSHLGAAWLAKRIGLVNTMVFTHIPSSLLLMTVAFAPDLATAAVLFLLREGLVEMDVPTRQSYVMALVRPEERTLSSGVTHLVRLAGWATGPVFAGALMQALTLGSPLVVGAAIKIAYDIALWRSFRGLKPPEER